ncbi:ABC transporter ATP-binding protein [Bacteroidia bacterium]|nr:ABC transporter ATP-binding protein [Bacteroidia bacterium]
MKEIMLTLQNINYIHHDKELLFNNLNLTVGNREKIALIGNNGIGKSTLLKIMAGILQPSSGIVTTDSQPYYVPQIHGQFDELTIAQALQVDKKLNALYEILDGKVTENNLAILNDDWTIDEKCRNALKYWNLDNLELCRKIETLSGGQKTKIFLAGISIHQPELILLDEPSNHLDTSGRQFLYDFILSTSSSLIVVSHDRKLLNLLNPICEMSKHGITIYGGNYNFYAEQKQMEENTLNQDIQSKEKTLRKAKEKARETLEREQKLDARGKKKQEKAGIARIVMNTLRNNAENSTSKLKSIHTGKISNISEKLHELRSALPEIDKIRFGFDNSTLHKGKILINIKGINFSYDTQLFWKENLNFQITSGERIALKGLNGSGKTTLIKLILGDMEPQTGNIYRVGNKPIYIDQNYSLINNHLKVHEQARQFNVSLLRKPPMKYMSQHVRV